MNNNSSLPFFGFPPSTILDSSLAPSLPMEEDEIPSNLKKFSVDMTETKAAVKKWLELDKSIKLLQKEVLQKKKEKQTLNEYIITFMKNNDIPFFNLNQEGQLTLRQNQVKTPLNQKTIQETIQSKLSKEDANLLYNAWFVNRPLKEKCILKYESFS